ncbi:MAG: hypothetical protein HQK88_09070 [Nitrospirae bacterium]|nr:hypothetical protein [Nitrospirota bacterium]MBF0616953.1 hypothetical protein [Nitrospirota bacterium]
MKSETSGVIPSCCQKGNVMVEIKDWIPQQVRDDKVVVRDDKVVVRDDKVVVRDDKGVVRDDKGVVRDDKGVVQDDRVVVLCNSCSFSVILFFSVIPAQAGIHVFYLYLERNFE